MITIRQLLKNKGHEVHSVGPFATLFDAIKIMTDEGVGAIVVMDADKIIGIITERHYVQNVVSKGKSILEIPVQEIMTTRVLCAGYEQSIEQCMAVMTDKRVRHLPVLDNDQLVGIVSIGDLVKSAIADQKFVIEQLENYIHG